MKILCEHCQGQCEVEEWVDCSVCSASGWVIYEFGDGTSMKQVCGNCLGRKGYNVMVTCPECKGTGEVDDN